MHGSRRGSLQAPICRLDCLANDGTRTADGIEPTSFPGWPAISRETSFAAGRNRLALTLIATHPVDGVVVTRLERRVVLTTFEARGTASRIQ